MTKQQMYSLTRNTSNPSVVAGLKTMGRTPKKEQKPTAPPKEKRARIWAVDFDGTLHRGRYPNIGAANEDLISALQYAKACGVRVILYTNRAGDSLEEALNWCHTYGLWFDAVNDNLPEIIETFGANTRKIFADLYIDDRAFPWWGDGEKGDLCKLVQKL